MVVHKYTYNILTLPAETTGGGVSISLMEDELGEALDGALVDVLVPNGVPGSKAETGRDAEPRTTRWCLQFPRWSRTQHGLHLLFEQSALRRVPGRPLAQVLVVKLMHSWDIVLDSNHSWLS